MPKQISPIAELAKIILQYRPLGTENGSITGYAPKDPDKDWTRDELITMIACAMKELIPYMERNAQMAEQYMVLVEAASDAHATLCMLGIRDLPLRESVEVLHDKYMQMVDILLKISTTYESPEKLRSIAEQGLVFYGPREAVEARRIEIEDPQS